MLFGFSPIYTRINIFLAKFSVTVDEGQASVAVRTQTLVVRIAIMPDVEEDTTTYDYK